MMSDRLTPLIRRHYSEDTDLYGNTLMDAGVCTSLRGIYSYSPRCSGSNRDGESFRLWLDTMHRGTTRFGCLPPRMLRGICHDG